MRLKYEILLDWQYINLYRPSEVVFALGGQDLVHEGASLKAGFAAPILVCEVS